MQRVPAIYEWREFRYAGAWRATAQFLSTATVNLLYNGRLLTAKAARTVPRCSRQFRVCDNLKNAKTLASKYPHRVRPRDDVIELKSAALPQA